MEKEKKYFKELKKKVDIYFVIIISMLSSLSIYMLYERKILNQENIYVLMAILTISFIVYIFSIIKNFKSKNINELDKAIFISKIFLITSFFMIIIIKSIKNKDLLLIYNLTKRLTQRNITISFTVIITSIIIVLTVLSLILIIRRFFLFKKINNTKETQLSTNNQSQPKEKNNKKMYSLKDIYNNSFELDDTNKIVIKDSDDDVFDIFGMQKTTEELKESIIASKNYKEGFSIGVVGEWGIGKSTIIDLTKNGLENSNDFVIIDNFDPWAIKSQDALILAMYNTIMENLGENIGYFKRKKVHSALINITTNIPYIGKGIGNYFENRIDDYSEYKEIKADLEEKLKKSDKRLVFIIDNLDRTKSDNVLFLLTLIGTLFKLPNITYIIAYDRNRLKNIFKIDDINPKYLEKTINKEIFMPAIDRQTLEICLKNLTSFYNYHLFPDYITRDIIKKFTNIRQFICFCNSLDKKPKIFDELKNACGFYLDIESDFITLQAIKFFDNNVYLKIIEYKDIILEYIRNDSITDYLKENFEDCYDLVSLLFLKNRYKSIDYSILDSTLFTICFFNIDKNIQNAINCISKLESDFNMYRKSESTLEKNKNENDIKIIEDYFQKDTLLSYFSIRQNPSIYDITNTFSLIKYLIKFKKITFKQKEILWNLLTLCTSHSQESLYSKLLIRNDELKISLDYNIKICLKCILNNLNKNELKTFTQNQLNSFKKNKEEYCKKLLLYECIFDKKIYENLKQFIKDLYKPIFDEPIFLWDEDTNNEENSNNYSSLYTSSYFYNCLNNNYNSFDLCDYTNRIYKKVKKNGQHLYEFIKFFIIKKHYIQDYFGEINNFLPVPENIYDLIKQYPPKNHNEIEIKNSFENIYPIKKKNNI